MDFKIKNKFIFIFLLITINKSFIEKGKEFINKKLFLKREIPNDPQLVYQNECYFPKEYSIQNLIHKDISIYKNYILILELYKCHYECTPGFSKYFIDLGYNVDVVMYNYGKTTFCFFDEFKKIRLFPFNSINEIRKNSHYLSIAFQDYKLIFIETTWPNYFELYKILNSLNIKKTVYVFHHIDFVNLMPFKNQLKSYQIVSLGNFSIGNQINPHYFGNFKQRNKNNITTFFITSTIKRNYKYIVSTFKKIKQKNMSYRIIVVGKTKTFSLKNIPENMKKNIIFKYYITYAELYKEVYNSDFIIINLDPNNKADEDFTKIRVTGSAQLAYGFLKPVLIHKQYSNFYNFNYTNSLIYDHLNFTKTIKKAINMDTKYYKQMQENLSLLSSEIYMKSKNNLRNCLNSINI